MVKKLYTESYIEDIADAIREKNGSSATYTTAQMGPAIRAIPTGGGSAEVVNGIIEYYKAATGTISANTFVEFVNEIGGGGLAPGTDTLLSNGSNSYNYASAVALDANTVFIAHRNGTYLYGVVCTISGTTITPGTDTQLSTTGSAYNYASAVALDANTVFVACMGRASNTNRLYGVVCTISGTTITPGTPTELSSASTSHYGTAAILVGSNKVFISHNNGGYLHGLVCTISGTTITPATDTQLSSGSVSYQNASPVLIDTDKVFISHNNGGYLYGVVCTISGTTITPGTDTQLFGESDTSYNSATLLDTNKVFIAHRGAGTSSLYGVVCTISGATITVGTDTQLAPGTFSYQYCSAVTLDSATVFIAHRGGGNSYLYGVVCTISGTTITPGTDTQLSTEDSSYGDASAVLLGAGVVFIAHRGGQSYLYGTIPGRETVKLIQPSTTKIEGLTKTAATTTTAGDVWVLNV